MLKGDNNYQIDKHRLKIRCIRKVTLEIEILEIWMQNKKCGLVLRNEILIDIFRKRIN